MVQGTSVVTPERFASGLSYQEYLSGIKVNQDKFQQNYQGTTLSDEQVAKFKALMARPNGPARMLVIGEDWCPDVYRGMPVAAKLAEATGLEMRVFPRDENLDIMNEFLKNGEFQSIPTLVFYTKDHRYITHWIERAQKANDEMPIMREIYAGRTREEAADDVAAFQMGDVWAGWRTAQLNELTEILDEKTR
ncbi:MAG: thioredoxin family protein [Chloroflexi bacterium]|nr:thioredoxin family protein [Chloroflexota bacterium]